MALLICLTVICLACLTTTAFLVWWTMSSSGQHSISAGKQQARQTEILAKMVDRSTETVEIQAKLTETLLLGREMPATGPPPELERPTETSPTPDDLWKQLPENIRDAMVREAEEEATWQSPSEMLLNPYPEAAKVEYEPAP
jgi:hypothetical protein